MGPLLPLIHLLLHLFWSWLRPEARSLQITLWETYSCKISSPIHWRQMFEYGSQSTTVWRAWRPKSFLGITYLFRLTLGHADHAACNNCLERKQRDPKQCGSQVAFPVNQELIDSKDISPFFPILFAFLEG